MERASKNKPEIAKDIIAREMEKRLKENKNLRFQKHL
jgi:hypothetical protein